MKKYPAITLFVLIMAASSIRAADGDLDVTFGVGGKVTTDFGLNGPWSGSATTVRRRFRAEAAMIVFLERLGPYFFAKSALHNRHRSSTSS